ncbi:flavin reductase family protein [Methylococcus geothermalis]|uniref:Flavin reductase n=1 Tax=Methylococcus geothermalis TaxID=2681310 RepID=A0A858Q618_9GAMM|nr:flavin reductase family protein [Methylococcus geothermalis]QJD29244.1 flavin reductase [Methylococcus geothermalis]
MNLEMARLFRSISHGVYAIGVADAEGPNAFTAAWVMQTSFDPPMLALSINPICLSYRKLMAGGFFSVNVVPADRPEWAGLFARPADSDKLAGIAWTAGQGGVPLLADAVAWFQCRLAGTLASGDHVVAVGRVFDGRLNFPEREPLSYRDTGDLDGSAALYPDGF